jgi:hypothetical protein
MVIDIAKKIIISFVFVLSSYGYNESMRFDPSLGRYNDCSGGDMKRKCFSSLYEVGRIIRSSTNVLKMVKPMDQP